VAAPWIEVVEVLSAPRRVQVDSRGTVAPSVRSELTSRVSGEVLEVSDKLRAGAFFQRGELLLRIDDADYRSAVAMRKAELAQARLALAVEEKEASIAQREWQELDLGGREPDPLVLRVPQLEEARARVQAATASLEKAELDLERTRIVAPYDGQTRERLVDVGRFLSVGTVLARIHGVESAEVRLPVLGNELAFLALPVDLVAQGGLFAGPEVTLRASPFGTPRSWTARIERLEGQVDARTQMLYVVARVEDPYGLRSENGHTALPMGLHVRATIHGTLLDPCLVIPRRALQPDGAVRVVAGGPEAATVLHRRAVEVLREQGEEVFLRAGVEAGERLCVTPVEGFVEGMTVRLVASAAEGEG
jgi:RND family efflux transporter MFP subunit